MPTLPTWPEATFLFLFCPLKTSVTQSSASLSLVGPGGPVRSLGGPGFPVAKQSSHFPAQPAGVQLGLSHH